MATETTSLDEILQRFPQIKRNALIPLLQAVQDEFDVAVKEHDKRTHERWEQRRHDLERPVLDPHRDFIVERIRQTSHLTLHDLKDELATRGVKVSHDTVWRFLRREGLSFKKNTVRS